MQETAELLNCKMTNILNFIRNELMKDIGMQKRSLKNILILKNKSLNRGKLKSIR